MAALHRSTPRPSASATSRSSGPARRSTGGAGAGDGRSRAGPRLARTSADALRATVPATLPPAVVHGDFRLGNLLADRRPDHRRDRLGDLGGRRSARRPGMVPGQRRPRHLPAAHHVRSRRRRRDELAEVYAAAIGRDGAGPRLVPGSGVLQVGGDLVADRQAQPPQDRAGPRPRGDGGGPAVAAARAVYFLDQHQYASGG